MNIKDARLENEIRHGKYLLEHGAGEIWNWETPAGKLRWKRRVKMLSKYITEGMKVLELGCGTGYFTKELINTNAEIKAIDISPDLIEIAKHEIKATNIEFIIANAYDLIFEDNTFDSIVGSSVLHHLEINKSINECFRVLKPGGYFVFTEPNMINPQIAIQKNIPWIKRKLGDSPDETAFMRWTLAKKLEKAGFKEVNILPFDFLHPKTPKGFIKSIEKISAKCEALPIIKEIAGSLFISARK